MCAMFPPPTRQVVLCDRAGNAQGTCDVMDAHRRPGMLHRAFSVFVFRQDGRELLIQQRSGSKPLFSRLWANSCCSHPARPDEDVVVAAERRLEEELGFTLALQKARSFVYRAEDPRARGVEHEHDTVLVGRAREAVAVRPDPSEIAAWKWIGVSQLRTDLQQHPQRYAPWLAEALRIALAHLAAVRDADQDSARP